MDMSTIQIRIDEKTKKQASKVFKSLGLDMSSGIKLYLQQVSMRKGIPFLLYTENGMTVQQEGEILKAVQEAHAGKNVTQPMSHSELLTELNDGGDEGHTTQEV
jgi:DNA-damage-inducible protein J